MTSPLSEDERALLSMRADEFHEALRRGAGSDWQPFLTGLPERVRLAVLTELVIIDLINRWERKERPEIEEYVARYPEFGPLDRVPNAVILEEYRCRKKAGERYDVARYKSRFPTQYQLIKGELEAAESPMDGTIPGTVTGTVINPRQHFDNPRQIFDTAPIPAPAPAPASTTSSVAEEYEFVRALGRGVFGEVWLARKKTSGIEKAIKIVTQSTEKESSKRERRSLELIKNLRHPYLLCTEDFWVVGNRLHIVMELAECTLRNRLEKCQENGLAGIPASELLGYIREAAEGLDFLHSRHVVHRDVKPDNILILNGHAKVADFGLAWHQDKLLAPMKTFAGTPAYMAPEVWGKEGGPPSDQYSLAVAYVELRQGHPPMMSQQIEEMMFAHLDGSHDFDSIIREEERRILAKALARKPEERYSSCMVFVEELSIALGVSFVPRSGVLFEAQSRLPASGSEAGRLDSRPRSPSTRGGSISTGSMAQSPAETHAKTGSTVADSTKSSGADSGIAQRKPSGSGIKTAVAALITLGLIGVFATALWALFGNSGQTQSTATTNRPTDDIGTQPTAPGAPAAKTAEPIKTVTTQTPITVSPPEAPLKPDGAEAEPNAQIVQLVDGRKVYEAIFIRVGEDQVRFRLIDGSQVPRPFYMMESKVWNNLFRAGKTSPPTSSEENGPDAPVTGVTVGEAMAFARNVLRGKLPSTTEWDLAAGFYANTGRNEVTKVGGKPRFMIASPKPTNGPEGEADINHFGLRDMAGNGREWTRMILTAAGEREIGSTPPSARDRIVLRGHSFTFSSPLTFEMLRNEQTTPLAQFASVRSPYTSFRVAIPMP